MKKSILDLTFIVFISVLLLGIININLVLVAVLCFTLPFLTTYIYKKKVWCQSLCPRSSFLLKVIGKISLKRKTPKFLTSKRAKHIVLLYFLLGMSVMVGSTIIIGVKGAEAVRQVNFLIMLPLIKNFPQVIDFEFNEVITHLSYRMYSMILTTSIIGTVLGIIYKPKTWCVICPVMTITNTKVFKPKKSVKKTQITN